MSEYQCVREEACFKNLLTENAQLRAENEQLRNMVQVIAEPYVQAAADAYKNAIRPVAITADAGAKLAERVKKLEWVAEAAKRACDPVFHVNVAGVVSMKQALAELEVGE